MSKYYIAYGSNLSMQQMYERCKTAEPIGSSVLKNYRLAFCGAEDGAAYLTIEPCEGKSVPVGIYKLGVFDELKLDNYEGYPTLYSKKTMKVMLDGQEIEGLIYIMNPLYDYHRPSFFYYDVCLEGYIDFSFDEALLDEAYKYSEQKAKEQKQRMNQAE